MSVKRIGLRIGWWLRRYVLVPASCHRAFRDSRDNQMGRWVWRRLVHPTIASRPSQFHVVGISPSANPVIASSRKPTEWQSWS